MRNADDLDSRRVQDDAPPLALRTARRAWGKEPIPLSFAQERLWFLHQLGLVGAAYNMRMAVRLEGDLNVEALQRSFTELTRRHEPLRTRFAVEDGVPHQLIDPPTPFEIHRADLSYISQRPERETQLRELMQREQVHQFDLSSGPLLRVVLVKLDGREHVLVLTIHHIVSDGWSLGVLRRELSTLYCALSEGRASPLPDLPVQYADYAMWQRMRLQGELLQEQLRYWSEQLRGSPTQLELPTDRPRPAVESYRGAEWSFELPASLSTALTALARREGATLFMVFVAAYQILLSRWSTQRDVVVGSPIAGRTSPDIEELIGFFVNMLVLRTDVADNLTFRQLLERVKETTINAYAYQDLPFDAIVKELRPDRSLTRHPIFQVAIALRNYPQQQLELPGLKWTWTGADRVTTHFDLMLYLYAGGTGAVFEYATDLFSEKTIVRMAEHLRTVLEEIVTDPDRPICELRLLSDAEKRQLLVDWNATAAAYPQDVLVHELFERQALQTPQVVAVQHGEQRLTYAELNGRANQLARYLKDKGVGADDAIGLCMERSGDIVVGLLGILKAGAAYVPLDPNYPADRLRCMLEDVAPPMVLTQEELRGVLPHTQAEVVAVDTKWQGISRCGAENLAATERATTQRNLVYVIFTSGSTGRPKGTAMHHGAMVNLLEWHRNNLPTRVGQRVLQFAALSFDVAFQEIFSTLSSGGTLILPSEMLRKDPVALTEFLRANLVERLFVPPLVLQSIAEHCTTAQSLPRSLREVIAAGEQLNVTADMTRFFKQLDGCTLHNHYGPTETHVVTTLTLTGDPDQWPSRPSIGRPISNIQMYVLDAQRRPVATGLLGEIYIGGAGVATGYLRRPELTAERFVSDPFSADPQSRLYRTGDLGRWRADQTIEYVGRNDDQVKIRGFRVELGEIEAQLMRHEQVREAAVVVREEARGDKRLVAYVTARDQNSPSVESLRAHLRAVLPEHAVPGAFVIVESFPRTANGKLDRRALPAPDVGAYARSQYEPPQDEIEELVAEIWQELLRVERIGVHDNFFDLGGHSLLATRLVTHIRRAIDVDIPLRVVFEGPTIRELSDYIAVELGDELSTETT